MIYTLTLNPALDLELHIDQFQFNSVSRAKGSQLDCGGKGFNVSRMLKNVGVPSVAMGFIGGKNGERLESDLKALGIATDFTRIGGETRINVSIVADKNAEHVKVNEAGPRIHDAELERMVAQIKNHLVKDDWWVLGGSLPPGVPADFYARLITMMNNAGVNSILDTSGEALKVGSQAKPTLIKPNIDEALELVGINASEAGKFDDWVGEVLSLGPKNLVISLGKDGALYANNEVLETIESPSIVERNPIGAGDSLVAGLVWQLSTGADYATALRHGIACGAATASKPGTELGSKSDVKRLLASMSAESAVI